MSALPSVPRITQRMILRPTATREELRRAFEAAAGKQVK